MHIPDDLSAPLTILLDAHVHLHPCFDPTLFLDNARTNFRAAAPWRPGNTIGCLWLTDPAEQPSLGSLIAKIAERQGARWRLDPTAEPPSLLAHHESGDTLVLLAGRQIATRERLEVLALGGRRDFPSGQSLGDTVARVRESGAIAVIPWGFGKWWFRRRRLLGAMLTSLPAGGWFIGDNSGRPRGLHRSSLFELASSRGIYDVPGSDPLPLHSEIRKPGRLGCVLQARLDFRRPAEALTAALFSLRTQPPLFGRQASLAEFVRSQVGLRLARRPEPTPSGSRH